MGASSSVVGLTGDLEILRAF